MPISTYVVASVQLEGGEVGMCIFRPDKQLWTLNLLDWNFWNEIGRLSEFRSVEDNVVTGG